MLRTRLFFGLLPLLMVIVATGGYSIRVCHQLAGPLQRDLITDYQAALACQSMRTTATLMSNALAFESPADPIRAKKELGDQRAAFTRELMSQSASSAGKPRALLVSDLDAAFQDYSALCERTLASGGAG